MANVKKPQRFFKGINNDISPSIQPDNTYRWANNMDVVAQGDEFIFNQVKSIAQGIASGADPLRGITAAGGNPVATPDAPFNILGYTQGLGIFNGVDKDCIVIFTSGTSVLVPTIIQKSTIFVYDCVSGALSVVGGSANPLSDGLNFPVDGSIDAIITRDRGIPIVYFVDGSNVMRRFVLDDSIHLFYQSVDELSVPRLKASQNSITSAEVSNNGNLLAGTYQFAFRLKNTTIGNFTKWSLFTNPIPIIPNNQGVVYGGAVGEVTNKSIDLEVEVSLEEDDLYDVIELATIKNNTGENVTQEVVFVSTHTIAGTPTEIQYAGSEAEFELPITEVVVDDAAIESVSTLVESNNRIIAGNVRYFDRLVGDGEGLIKEAVTVKRSVDYKDEENSKDYIGHFRGEVYRFGITYVDRFGNWSAVKPLDFSKFKRTEVIDVPYTAVGLNQRNTFGNYSDNAASVIFASSSVSDFLVGDTIRINFGTVANPDYRYYDVFDIDGDKVSFAAYEALPTTTLTDTTIYRCLGNSYSHSASSDWKFVGRDKFGYSILDGSGDAQALGLQVVLDGTTHPEWAVGVAVVRMERDKNIVYQTPIVPAREVIGVCTPGKNTSTNNDYPIGSNGVGQFDHLAPKILQLGTARDMIRTGITGTGFNAYEALSFRTVDDASSFENTASTIDNRWDVAFAPAVDFIANNLGVALGSVPENQELNISLVDIAALTKTLQPNSAGAKVYECLDKSKYFHDGTISSQKVEDPASIKNYFPVYYPRIQDTIACQYRRLSQQFLDTEQWKTTEIYPIVNGSEGVPLQSAANAYLGSRAVRLVSGEALTSQQSTTQSIPAASRDLFLGNIGVQRTLAIKMNQQLLDPLAPISKIYDPPVSAYLGREVLWSNYLSDPTTVGATVSRRLYNNTDMLTPYRSGGLVDAQFPSLLSDRVVGETQEVDLAQAMFIVNLEAGKSDFRYGAANSAKRYIWTGAYAPITDTDDITLDVWGGDCVISEFTYRVNDNTVIPRVYAPVAGQDNVSWGAVSSGRSAAAAKAGVSRQQPEYIRLFVEAECNANFFSDRNRFPVKDSGISDYTAPAFYDYNFGYSIRNTAKSFFSQDQSVNFIQNFPARLIFSDARVAQSTDDGYSRFRALNFFDLEEKYGGVTRLALLNDSEPIAVQERAIRYLFVGKNVIQDEGGTALSVQSGEFFSNVIKYLSITYGAENLRCVLSTEYGVFILDSRNGMLLNISDGLKLISQGRIDKYLNYNFSSKKTYFERRLSLSYDSVAKEVHLIGFIANSTVSNSQMYWLRYNAKIDSFVSAMDYNVANNLKNYTLPSFVVGAGGTSFLIHSNYNSNYYDGGWDAITLQIGKMREGSTFGQLLLGSTAQAASIDFVSNEAPDEPKTFAIVGSNSALPFTSYEVTAFNEQQTSETTGTQSTEIHYRNGQAYAPFIRDNVSGGRLRGAYAIIRLSWSQTNLPARIYSVFSQFRKLFRP